MAKRKGKKSRRSQQVKKVTHQLESLEARKMLTTVVGGEVFQYTDLHGQLIRVTVGGHAVVELIGARSSLTGGLVIDDLPGTFVTSSIGRANDTVLTPGCKLIGATPIADPIVPGNSQPIPNPFPAAGAPSINIQAIATNAAGQTYGFNVYTANNVTVAQLVSINNQTGAATVLAEVAGVGGPNLVSIEAAAFNPLDGLLYFVTTNGGANNTPVLDTLHSINVATLAVSAPIPGTFNEAAPTSQARRIRGMTFDQYVDPATQRDVVRLLVLTAEGAAVNSPNRIITVDPTNSDNFGGSVNVTFVPVPGGAAVALTNLTDISIGQDDPLVPNTAVFAVQAATVGANSGFYTINLPAILATPVQPPAPIPAPGNAVAILTMLLPDPGDVVNPIRGQNIQSLTWNPTLRDPSTGALGLLIATDTTSDELVYIPARTSSADELYAIYVAQASAGDSISIAAYNVTANSANLVPYDGVSPLDPQHHNAVVPSSDGRFALEVANATNGQATTINFADGVGGVYIGLHTFNGANPPVRDVPVIAMALAKRIGTRPVGLDDLPTDGLNNAAAGVTVAPSLLDYLSASLLMGDRLMGANLDQIAGLAVRRDLTLGDSIVVVDVDGTNIAGGIDAPVVLATLSPTTGQATSTPIPVIDSMTGLPAAGFWGMAFSDVNFSGLEDLYSILTAASPIPAQSIGALVGNVTDIAMLGNGNMYAVNFNGTSYDLYQVQLSNNGNQVTGFTLVGAITFNGLTVSGIQTLEGDTTNPAGPLYGTGLATSPLPTLQIPGDLGGNFKVVGLSSAPNGQIYAAVDNGTTLDLYQVLRNAQGDITNFVRVGGLGVHLTGSAVNTAVLGIHSMDAQPGTGALYFIGMSADQMAPTQAQGSLGSALITPDLAVTGAGGIFAISANAAGTGYDLYQVVRDANGQVSGFNLIGPISLSSDLRGAQTLEADATNPTGSLYTVANPLPFLPTQQVPGDLGGSFNVVGLSVTASGELYAAVDNGTTIDLYHIIRDAAGDVTAFARVGQLGVDLDNNGSTETALLGVRAMDAQPGSGVLYLIGMSGDQLAPSQDIGPLVDPANPPVQPYNIVAVTAGANSDIWMLNQTDAGVQLVSITRDGTTGVVIQVTPGGLVTSNGNPLVNLASLEAAPGGGFLTVASETPIPIPTISIGNNLGAHFNVADLAVAGPVGGERMFASVFNGTNYDLYEVQRQFGPAAAIQGQVGAFVNIGNIRTAADVPINFVTNLEGDFASAGTVYAIGSTDPDAANLLTSQSLYAIDTATGIATPLAALDLTASGLPAGQQLAGSVLGLAQSPLDPTGDTFHFTMTIQGAPTVPPAPPAVNTSALFTVTKAGVVTFIAEIDVAGAATDIRGLDFSSNFGTPLYGIDKLNNQMVQIDLVAPDTASVAVGATDPNLHGLTSDHAGNFYSDNSPPIPANPSVSIGNNLGDQFNIQDLAVAGAAGSERMFAVHFNGTNFDLYEVQRDFTGTAAVPGQISGFVKQGTLRDAANNPIFAVDALEGDAADSGLVYVIATPNPTANILSNLILYSVDANTGIATPITPIDIATVLPLAQQPLGADVGGVRGLAQSPTSPTTFYFDITIEAAAGGPTSGLFTITTAGVLTFINEIDVAAGPVDIRGIDFAAVAIPTLFGLDKLNNQMVQIDLTNPDTASAAAGAADVDLHGLTSDHAGHFYSDHSGVSTGQSDQIWVTIAGLPDEIWTEAPAPLSLFTVDNTGVATLVGNLVDVNNVAVVGKVTALSLRADGTLFAVLHVDSDGDGVLDQDQLITIDTASGQVTANLGAIQVGGVGTQISGMDFTSTGDLVAVDKSVDPATPRLIAINTTDPTQSQAVTDPTVTVMSTDLRGLASDPTGRFFAVDESNPASPQLLISTNTQQILTVSDPANSAQAVAVAPLQDRAEAISQPVTDIFGAMAFYQNASNPADPLNGTLYAVQEDFSAGGIDRLVTINLATGEFTRVGAAASGGAIVAGTAATHITAMDFSYFGHLIGIDATSGTEVDINLTAPQSSAFVGAIGVTTNLMGLNSTPDGEFFSISNASDPNVLLASATQMSLLTIDPAGDPLAGLASATVTLVLNGSPIPDQDTMVGLAMDNTGALYGVLHDPDTQQDHLLWIDVASGTCIDLGTIQVDGVDTLITGVDVSAGGELIAIDKSGGPGQTRLIALNRDAASLSSALTDPTVTHISDNLTGLASDTTGRFYGIDDTNPADPVLLISPGNEQLFKVTNPAADTTAALVATLSDPAATPAQPVTDLFNGLSFNPLTGGLYGVQVVNAVDQLVTINPVTGVITRINAIQVGGTGTQVTAMDFGSNGDLLAIDGLTDTEIQIDIVNPGNSTTIGALTPGLVGLTADPQGFFLSVLQDADPATPDLLLISFKQTSLLTIDPATGQVTAAVPLSLNGVPIADPTFITGLAMDSAGVFYAVVRDPNAGQDHLVQIDPATGICTDLGVIRVNGQNTQIDALEFLSAGGAGGVTLIAYDDSQGPGARRAIIITVGSPGTSTVLGAVDDGLVGLADNGAGRFYSVNRNLNQLWISPVATPQLGILNTATGIFTTISPLASFFPANTTIVTLAFAPDEGSQPGQAGLYVVDTAGVLYEVSYTTSGGVISAVTGVRPIGTVTDAVSGQTLNIGGLAFDKDGVLYGQDVGNGRLVDISLVDATAGANVATAPGSLRPSVGAVTNLITAADEWHGAIAYDFTNDRFLAADNATSSFILPNESSTVQESAVLMVFKGYSNSTDVGQNIANILIGGVLTGQVKLSGSVNLFYAGVILTGNTGGEITGGTTLTPTYPGNFSVAGDLRELITSGSIGSNNDDGLDNPTYLTGFDLSVGGRVDQILTLDSFLGSLTVNNNVSTDIYTANDFYQAEIEHRISNINAGAVGTEFGAGNGTAIEPGFGLMALDGRWNNDTLDTAQYLGTLRNGAGLPDVIHVSGYLSGPAAGDTADYYSVALMAGQTITVQLLQTNLSNLTVYDPDGRLIASNTHGSGNVAANPNEPLVFQTDRPGNYRIGVGWTLPGASGILQVGAYEFMVSGVGTMALGALVARNNIMDAESTISTATVANGDLGALVATNSQIFAGLVLPTLGSVVVLNGNLREMLAANIGILANNVVGSFPYVNVPSGSIGLVRTTGALMGLITFAPVGKDIQVIDAADQYFGEIATNGGIGSIIAGQMTVLGLYTIAVNADGIGNDGIIDLIDVTGNLGTLGAGGPAITTGPGGDVRYMRVGGTIYQDPYFQVGDYNPLVLLAGQTYTQVDDGGGQIRLAPGQQPNPAFNPSSPQPGVPQFLRPGILTIRQYSIEGSAGSVLVDVTSSDGGVEVTGLNTGPIGPVEIGSITVQGIGRDVIFGAVPVGSTTPPVLQMDPAGTQDLNVLINGPMPVDVLDIIGTNLSTVSNNTGGEIVDVNAASVGNLTAKTLGLARNHTGAAVNPRAQVSNVFPFIQQHIGIVVTGNLLKASATTSLGNLIVSGAIGTVTANSDNRNTTGGFEGITAPVFAGGEIALVQIGQGVAPSGTGEMSQAGIYANGIIRSVVNQGLGSDVYGNIVSTVGILSVSLHDGAIIGSQIAVYSDLAMSATVGPGVILAGDVGTVTTTGVGGIIGTTIIAINVGNITVAGNGFGFITSIVQVVGNGTIGNVSASGFGIRNSQFFGASNMGNMTATGQGQMLQGTSYTTSVRGSETAAFDPRFLSYFNTANDLDLAMNLPTALVVISNVDIGDLFSITLSGGGSNNSATVSYRAQAATVDDVVVGLLNAWTTAALTNPLLAGVIPSTAIGANGDVELQLTASAGGRPFLLTANAVNAPGGFNTQKIQIISNRVAGVIDGINAQGTGNLGAVSAYRIGDTVFDPQGINYLTFANSTASITTKASIDADPITLANLTVRTGKLGTFSPGADVSTLNLTVAGRIATINIKGNMLGSSVINATGPNGSIGTFSVAGNLDGSVFAESSIGTFTVGGDMTGSITANGVNVPTKGKTLGSLILHGALSGTISVTGNVGTIQAFGDLGIIGDTLTITGNLTSLQVGTNAKVNGSTLAMDVFVAGNLTSITVTGKLEGSVYVGGDLGSLTVTADPVTAKTPLIDNDITVGRDLGALIVTGGDVGTGDTENPIQITAGRNIGKITLTSANVAADATISSLLGSIQTVAVNAGSIFGNLVADNGSISSVTVTGSSLGGTISADSAGIINFAGNIYSGASIDIAHNLATLIIGKDVQAGSSISLGSAGTINVGQDLLGSLSVGYGPMPVTLTIGRNFALTPTTGIDADSTITVKGSVSKSTDDSHLWIGRNLTLLNVTGMATMDLIVDGAAGTIALGSLGNSVVTMGLDLNSLTVTGLITNSLVQVGASAGNDGTFAATAATQDSGEESRLANINIFHSGAMTNSIVAAGGSINNFAAETMTNSSVSSGLSLGSSAIAGVLADTTPLATSTELNAARSGADQVLLRGDINVANVTGSGMIGSSLTAGVAPGTGGDFSNPTILNSATGGSSRLGAVTGTLGAGSRLVSDSPILADQTIKAGGSVATVGYSIAGLTTGMGHGLESLIGVASATTPFSVTVGGNTFNIVMSGPGTVSVYDAAPDQIIDTLVLAGTTSGTAVVITTTPTGSFQVGRVLTADDATVGTFNFDGDLAGDGTAAPDLWIDGPVSTFRIRNLGDNVTGQIGGAVNNLAIQTQGAGRVVIGGAVNTLNILNASNSPLVTSLGTYNSRNFNTITVSSTGATWAHAGGILYRVNPAANAPAGILQSVNLTDTFSGTATPLLGADFAGGTLYGLTRLYDPNPTQAVGVMASTGTLTGLAVNPAGQAYAISTFADADTVVRDHLVTIDSATGTVAVVGTLRNPIGNFSYSGNILTLAFDNAGRLLALVNDRDGTGATDTPASGVALVQIDTTAANGFTFVHRLGNVGTKGVLLNGGGITDAFTASAMGNGVLYAIRRTGGTKDTLVGINTATGAVTTVGDIRVQGGAVGLTSAKGMGIDENGNLLVLDNDGVNSRLIYLTAADLTANNAANFQDLSPAANLNTALDAFAVGQTTGAPFRTYAYDNAGSGVLYTNPIDPTDALGRVTMLGTINTTTGKFSRAIALADAAGNPISIPATQTSVPMAVDNAGSGKVYFVTPGALLMTFDPATSSMQAVGLLHHLGANDRLQISAIEFNDLTGQLFGVDSVSRQIVQIDLATAAVTATTSVGSVPGGLTDLAFNPTGGGKLLGYVINPLAPATDQFVQFKGTDAASEGGLIASSVGTLTLGIGDYAGRVFANGSGFNTIVNRGNFSGTLETPGRINSFTSTGGTFGGTLAAGMGMNTVSITGDVAAAGRITDGGWLQSFNQITGDFAGMLSALGATTVTIGGSVLDGADLNIPGGVTTLKVTGDFGGSAELGTTNSLQVGGALGGNANLFVAGDANTLAFGGSATGATVIVTGKSTTLTLGGTHQGMVAIRKGLGSATLGTVTGGMLLVGMDTNSLKVSGDSDQGLFSFGTWIGADGVYNTADDLITGGSIATASFARRFTDSVIAAGVLPEVAVGPGLPADEGYYAGFTDTTTNNKVDSAEAGGILPSRIGQLNILGQITSSGLSATGYGQSSAVAANGIGTTKLPKGAGALAQRVYGDPLGAPTVVSAGSSGTNFRIVFSEEMDTGSFILSRVLGDGGNIILTQNGAVPTNLTMIYSTQVSSDGVTQGVLTISRPGGFDPNAGPLAVSILGTGLTPVYDRSGLRSALRLIGNPVDPPGTILDGDQDGVEGGNFGGVAVFGDAPNTFVDAISTVMPILVDGNTLSLTQDFTSGNDVDVFHFTGTQGQYFSAQFDGLAVANMGVFFRDTQGTADPSDDTFNVLARHDTNRQLINDETGGLSQIPTDLFEAYELPETGDYFVVVAPDTFSFDSTSNNVYTLNMTLASTDAQLAVQLGATLNGDTTMTLADGSVRNIAYVSNAKRVSKQLVYLDFGLGVSTQVTELGPVVSSPFDASLLDPSLAGQENTLINGNNAMGVTGIVDNIMGIYQTIPASFGTTATPVNLNVHRIDPNNPTDWAAYQAATTGLWFTTVDPASQGLIAGRDFTTVFIGQTNPDEPGLLGIASNIDVAGESAGDEALVFLQNFAGGSSAAALVDRLNQYSLDVANTAAHELGHTLGLNHQPTDFVNFNLILNDPDNNPGTLYDGNVGAALMAYATPDIDISQRELLGTAPLTTNEFPIGDIDTAQLLLRWFGTSEPLG